MWPAGRRIVALLAAVVFGLVIGAPAATINTLNGPVTFNSLGNFPAGAPGSGGTGGRNTGGQAGCSGPGTTTTIDTSSGDAGAAINAADQELGVNTGTIQVNGGGNITSQIVISSCHTLSFGPGTWTNSIQTNPTCSSTTRKCETILLKDHTVMQGAGETRTIIKEAPDIGGGSYVDVETAFVVAPWSSGAGNGNAPAPVHDITLHDFQISGVGIRRAANAAQQTIALGSLQGGLVTRIRLNGTHSIGLAIGQPSFQGLGVSQNVTITRNNFYNVGGCNQPPQCPGGGGVALAVINGNHVVISNNNFYDTLGNAIIDVEPGAAQDDIHYLTITGNLLSQTGSTGRYERHVYAIVLHQWSNGPIAITNNTITGNYYKNDPYNEYYPAWNIVDGINTNYVCKGCAPQKIDIEGNTLKYIGGSAITLFADNSTVKNNTIIMPNNNLLVIGSHNLLEGNIIKDNSTEGPYGYHGIEEQYNSDHNTFRNNRTSGICTWVDTVPNSLTYEHPVLQCNQYHPPTQPIHIVGPHSKSTSDVIIPRLAWPI